LLALSQFMDIEQVRITCRNLSNCASFEKELAQVVNCDFVRTGSIKEVCKCDILVTTTPVRSPIVKSEWIREGTHINAIGADATGKQEIGSSLIKRAKVVVDDIMQASHSGEVNVPISSGVFSQADIHAELGEVIAGIKPGRENDEEITIFDSTGLAVQDLVTADMVYHKALTAGIGTKMRLF